MPTRVLISTLPPFAGGVTELTRLVSGWLTERGYAPVVAYYEPYTATPRLSVPAYKLLVNRVAEERRLAFGEYEGHAVGCWMPELEFTHYLPTRPWRGLIESCGLHIAVTGNCLAAAPFALSGRPFWAWVATTWADDRAERVVTFPWYRRWLDRAINSRGALRLEKKVLTSGTIVALSRYTRDALNRVSPQAQVSQVMPMGINTTCFRPSQSQNALAKIGFIGRYEDPRKNIELFLDALVWCRERGQPVTAVLAGADKQSKVRRMVRERGLQEAVELKGILDHESLPALLSGLSVFVVPSHQEGLCVAALEAMACGVPVISTRCGGPEEFVRDGETGFLVEAAAPDLGRRILDIVRDDGLRSSLGARARSLIEKEYSEQRANTLFWSTFQVAFPMSEAA